MTCLKTLKRARITPAYAGKTIKQMRKWILRRDHPRLRGKDVVFVAKSGHLEGSPPLTRERQNKAEVFNFCPRITPAYAGKTNVSFLNSWSAKDHPRLRGKDLNQTTKDKIAIGSPPLTRERLANLCGNTVFYRITPAYAGKTE